LIAHSPATSNPTSAPFAAQEKESAREISEGQVAPIPVPVSGLEPVPAIAPVAGLERDMESDSDSEPESEPESEHEEDYRTPPVGTEADSESQGHLKGTIEQESDLKQASAAEDPRSARSLGGAYACTYQGCNVPPFHTQYLLNSHMNVHSDKRNHFCPVKDCPRGPGGRGFKRKNEMIRHGLVHTSPGYVCPYCPDQKHKYPRPDNLQRHIRAHHTEASPDDPQLRRILDIRPPGGTRGGRRRLRYG